MTAFFSIIGFLAVAFLLLLSLCEPMLDGTARRLTAHRLGLVAFKEARQRFMNQREDERVIRAVTGSL